MFDSRGTAPSATQSLEIASSDVSMMSTIATIEEPLTLRFWDDLDRGTKYKILSEYMGVVCMAKLAIASTSRFAKSELDVLLDGLECKSLTDFVFPSRDSLMWLHRHNIKVKDLKTALSREPRDGHKMTLRRYADDRKFICGEGKSMAIEERCIILKMLLTTGQKPIHTNGSYIVGFVNEYNPLCWAAQYGLVDLMRILVEIGKVDVNYTRNTTERKTALLVAISKKQVESVQFLASLTETNMNIVGNSHRDTALHLIVRDFDVEKNKHKESSDIGMLDAFLSAGPVQINLCTRNSLGKTPLVIAIEAGNFFFVKRLLDCGSTRDQLTTADAIGMGVLHHLVLNQHVDILEYAIELWGPEEQNLFFNGRSQMGTTALFEAFCVACNFTEADGENPRFKDRFDTSIEVIKILMKAFVSKDSIYEQLRGAISQNDTFHTLHLIAKKGRADLLRYLIAELDHQHAGFDLNIVDRAFRTPLCYACTYVKDEVAEILLNMGAHMNFSDQQGWNCLFFCIAQNNSNVLEKVLDVDEENRKRNAQRREGEESMADDNYDCHGDGSSSSSSGAGGRALNASNELNISCRFAASPNRTPLQFAAQLGHVEILTMLLKHPLYSYSFNMNNMINSSDTNLPLNPLVDEVDDNGFSALHIAVDSEHLHCVRELVNAGANINLPDKVRLGENIGDVIQGGDTPVHLAAKKNYTAITEFLFSSPRADTSILNASGKKALELLDNEDINEFKILKETLIDR